MCPPSPLVTLFWHVAVGYSFHSRMHNTIAGIEVHFHEGGCGQKDEDSRNYLEKGAHQQGVTQELLDMLGFTKCILWHVLSPQATLTPSRSCWVKIDPWICRMALIVPT